MRTTLDIDDPILRDLEKLQEIEQKPLGRLVSDLLATALQQVRTPEPPAEFHWVSKGMGARVDLADKDTVRSAMERSGDNG